MIAIDSQVNPESTDVSRAHPVPVVPSCPGGPGAAGTGSRPTTDPLTEWYLDRA